MNIKWGISNKCVLQRDDSNTCRVKLVGYVDSKSKITVTAIDVGGESVFSDVLNAEYTENANTVEKSKYEFKAYLQGVPVGGAYTVKFENDKDEIFFSDVLVGDVYLLGGQSNMQGIGRMNGKLIPKDDVRAFYMDDRWDIAQDPLHSLDKAIDPVHEIIAGGPIEPDNPDVGVGPGIAFAQGLNEITGIPQGLIACAHGGTTMDQWSPEEKDLSGESLYGAMLRRFYKNGGNVKGLFWYQGCSDTYEGVANEYYKKMVNFIKSIRQDTGIEDLPIVAVQIARQCTPEKNAHFWNTVQHSQYMLEEEIENLSVVPAIDLEMDDFIHISGKSQNRLGKRCADAMHCLNNENKDNCHSIRLKNIEVVDYDDCWNCKIILTYKNVSGSLISNGRPNGFKISKSPHKDDGNCIIRADLEGNKVVLHTTDSSIDINNCYLHYGLGFQPYCNITDEKDHALPVLYSLPIGQKKNLSEPCTFAWIDRGASDKFEYTVREDLINKLNAKYELRDFYYYFLNIYNIAKGKDDRIVFYIPFSIKENSEVTLLTGGIGGIKISMDGKLIKEIKSKDKNIHPAQFSIPLSIDKGVHILSAEYVPMAQGSKGIFLRFEGESGSAVPEWVK